MAKLPALPHSNTDDLRRALEEIDARDIAEDALGAPSLHTNKYDQYRVRADDDTASFTVYRDGFKDFGRSGQSGKTLALVELLFSMTRKQAIEYILCRWRGEVITPTTNRPPRQDDDGPRLVDAEHLRPYVEAARRRLQGRAGAKERAYLLGSRLQTEDTISRYGFTPEDTFVVTDLGTVWMPAGIVIPRYAADGKLIAVHTRRIVGELATALERGEALNWKTGKPTAKYMTRGAPAADVYGATALARENLRAIVFVEGEFDRDLLQSRLDAIGAPVAVVTKGSASGRLSKATIHAIRKTGATVYGLLDTDEAGQDGEAGLIDELRAAGLPFAHLPTLWAQKDVTDAARAGVDVAAAVLAAIEAATVQTKADINPDSHKQKAAHGGAPSAPASRTASEDKQQKYASPYLSVDALPRSGVVLIGAPMGSGKTEAVFTLLREMGAEFLSITHRVALATGQAARATRSGLTLASYKDVSELAQLAQIGNLAVCINTLALASKAALPRPRLRVVVLDEVKQLLRAIGEEHGTLKGDAPIALELLRLSISEADLVLAMDAHADAWTMRELERLAGKPVALVTHDGTIERPPVMLFNDRRALRDSLAAFTDGTLAIACASEHEAQDVYRELARLVADDARLLVTGKTAGATKQRAFLADPDAEAPRYRLIVYSPVVGTGISIMTPVDTLALLDAGRHLTGEDLAQMAGRFRSARQIIGWIRPDLDKERMTAEQLTAFLITLEKQDRKRSGHVFEVDADGRCVLPEQLAQFYGFQGRVMAENQRGIDQARVAFLTAFPRFTVNMMKGSKEAQAARKERQAAAIEALIARAAEVKPLSRDDYEKLCEAQGVTDDDDAAYLRWKVEDETGLPYTIDNGRELYDPKDLIAYRRLAYSAVDAAVVADEDADDLATGRLALNRPRRIKWARLGAIVRAALLKNGQPVELDAAELAQLDASIMAEIDSEATEIVVFGYDRAPKTARGRVAAICRALNLRLVKHRHEEKRGGKVVLRYAYGLNTKTAPVALALSAQIGARIVAKWYEKAQSHQFSESTGKGKERPIRKSGGQPLLNGYDRAPKTAEPVATVARTVTTVPPLPNFEAAFGAMHR